jgi:hypothetical protein
LQVFSFVIHYFFSPHSLQLNSAPTRASGTGIPRRQRLVSISSEVPINIRPNSHNSTPLFQAKTIGFVYSIDFKR